MVTALQRTEASDYAITPGDATPVGPLVTVHGVSTATHHDRIMLVDVYLESLTDWQWLWMHLQSHVQFVPGNELLSPGVPQSQLNAQGFLEMSDAKQAAEYAAFTALGWRVPETRSGAVIVSVAGQSPASRAHLAVADEVTAVDGHPVTSGCALVAALHPLAPGTRVRLRVERASISGSGTITRRAPVTILATTAAVPSGVAALPCRGVKGADRSWLGVGVEDGVRYALPATVSIDTRYIGGPSAGLAMTLALIDRLSRESVTGGRAIAATGEITPDGRVLEVGGVAEKAVAVARAGARIFFVPEGEVGAARSAGEPNLRIIGVTTLHQVLVDLHRMGGASPEPISTPR